MGKFIVMNMLRDIKSGKLNGSNSSYESYKGQNDNTNFTKKIRRDRKTYPYASGQWIKKNIKNYAESQGLKISDVFSPSSSQALTEGSPYINYDEDVMGYMNATKIVIEEEEYSKLGELEKKLYAVKGKKYEKNITKRRRQKLMVSPLLAIGDVKIQEEFSSRETEESSILYSKEIYSTLMSNSAIIAKEEIGNYIVSDNELGFRDYVAAELDVIGIKLEEGKDTFALEDDIIKERIITTIKGLQFLPTRINMANNLEDLSAQFIIMADYSIGNSVFNNIFEDNELKIDYLKEAIEENEEYRQSKIYIGCREQFMKQEELWLREVLEQEFKDDRYVIGGVGQVIDEYIKDVLD